MPVVPTELADDMIIPKIIASFTDRIPNVQFCALRIIEKHGQGMAQRTSIVDMMEHQLEEMMMDSDLEVAYFATITAKKVLPKPGSAEK